MKLKIRNEKIKIAEANERKEMLKYGVVKQDIGKAVRENPEQIAMCILWGYVLSLHEISESPEVGIDIDLTYATVKNVFPLLAYEFAVGMNPKSGYSLEANIEIAEKTMAAYFMLLAINDDTAVLRVDPFSEHPDNGIIFAPDSWSGLSVHISGLVLRCDLLKEIHGSVTYEKDVLTISEEKLVSAYRKVTGKDLRDCGLDGLQAGFKR